MIDYAPILLEVLKFVGDADDDVTFRVCYAQRETRIVVVMQVEWKALCKLVAAQRHKLWVIHEVLRQLI